MWERGPFIFSKERSILVLNNILYQQAYEKISISLVISKMQIKTTMRYYPTSIRMTTIKKPIKY